jgi:hypothetical protein
MRPSICSRSRVPEFRLIAPGGAAVRHAASCEVTPFRCGKTESRAQPTIGLSAPSQAHRVRGPIRGKRRQAGFQYGPLRLPGAVKGVAIAANSGSARLGVRKCTRGFGGHVVPEHCRDLHESRSVGPRSAGCLARQPIAVAASVPFRFDRRVARCPSCASSPCAGLSLHRLPSKPLASPFIPFCQFGGVNISILRRGLVNAGRNAVHPAGGTQM